MSIHINEPSKADKALWDWLLSIAFLALFIASLFLGSWPPVFAWLAFHWTTIWQALVVLLLVGVVGKR